jgi:alpha-glucosidase
VLLDLVPSHTSHLHPWFVDSRAGRDSARRDWYVWADPAPGGGPPNNWIAEFGGPAWTLDETTGQYYLHIYLPEQPALNWRNPQVREAMYGAMRFWFDRGVDGFRVDAAQHLAPDDQLRDNPVDPDWEPEQGPARRLIREFTAHRPEVYEIAREMRAIADAYPGDRVLIGETFGTFGQLMAYYGERNDGFHLPFNFELLTTPWRAEPIAAYVDLYETELPPGAWPNWVLSSHDRSRVASRIGVAQARVAAMLLLTLRGTPTIYQGDELGMEDVPIPPDAVQDPWERNVPGLGLGRDPVRVPIRWDGSPHGGFTTGRPWLPPATDPGLVVTTQEADPASMLSLHRALVALRRAEPALSVGGYRTVSVDDDVFVYERVHADRTLLVALNLSSEPRPLPVAGRSLLSTDPARPVGDEPEELGADEGVVLEAAQPDGRGWP